MTHLHSDKFSGIRAVFTSESRLIRRVCFGFVLLRYAISLKFTTLRHPIGSRAETNRDYKSLHRFSRALRSYRYLLCFDWLTGFSLSLMIDYISNYFGFDFTLLRMETALKGTYVTFAVPKSRTSHTFDYISP